MPATPLPVIGQVLRTPETRFAHLSDFPYTPHYTEVAGLRIACIDERPPGKPHAPIVLLMHGEPTWSYLYRKMIPVLVAAGYRVIAPDLVGFGRSDKPVARRDYTYRHHVAWMTAWMMALDLQQVTLFCQDWGSLIGLRMAAEQPERFARIALANGGLPTGSGPVPKAFKLWRAFSRYSPWFPIGRIVKAGCASGLSDSEVAAYDAPFPSGRYLAGARVFPGLVPTTPDDPERQSNEQAWQVLRQWKKPFITLFSNRDPITRGGARLFQQQVPGAQGQAHAVIRGAGHFLQEDKGVEVAQVIDAFIQANPIAAPNAPQTLP